MNETTKKITASLLDSLAVFLGIYGIIFGIITAYNLNVEKDTIVYAGIAASIYFSLLFYSQKYKKTLYTTTAVIGAFIFFINKTKIINGLLLFLHLITSKLNEFSSAVTPTKNVNLTFIGEMRANTAFFTFFGIVLALLLTLSIIKAHSLYLTMIISVSAFSLCLIFVKDIPQIGPIITFLMFITATVLTNIIRKSGSKRSAYMMSLFLPLTFIFLTVIIAIFPPTSYNRTDIANKIYSFFSARLPLTLEENTSNDTSYIIDTSGSPIPGDGSGSTPLKSTKKYQNVNLSNADSSKKIGKTDLKINTDKDGQILLRGFSLDEYTGSSWKQFDLSYKTKLKVYENITPFTQLDEEHSILCPISFPTFIALTSDSTQDNYIEIKEAENGGEIVYTPYFTDFKRSQNLTYYNDSVILYSDNSKNSLNKKAEYSFNFYNCDNIFNETQINNTYRENYEYTKIQQLEEDYRNKVYKYYTQINTDLSDFLYNYINGDDFIGINEKHTLVNAVADYVKNCAEYDLNTPTTPDGKDYVKYFLTESKKGYCMHFATTATLIFRTLGVPARYVTGYSTEIKEEQKNSWVDVTDKNAHAWVEVYFDGIGWIPVDVTPESSNRNSDISGSETSKIINTASGDESSSVSNSEQASSISNETSEILSSDTENSVNSEENITDESENIPFWIYIILLIFILIVFFILRRKKSQANRKKAFSDKNTNFAAINAWTHIEKLKAYGIKPDKHIYAIAQKAAFSRHVLSGDEKQVIIDYALKNAEKIDKSLNFAKRIVFRYIKALY